MRNHFIIAPGNEHMAPVVEHVADVFDSHQGTLLHQGRNEIRRITIGTGKPVIVKRYKRANIVQRIAYTLFRPSKCRRAYEYAARFRQLGIGTPRGLAYAELACCGLFRDGYFFCEECSWESAKKTLPDEGSYDAQLADAVVALVVELHKKGVLHGDLNLSNILFTKTADGYQFMLIDTNRSHFLEHEPSREQCICNLMRITHRRDLFEHIFRTYGKLRGWSPDATYASGLAALERFEHRKHIVNTVKKKLKLK